MNKLNLIILQWVIFLIKDWKKKKTKKEGLFKRLENIKDKNEELLNALKGANEVSKVAKSNSDYVYKSVYTFYNFYKDLEKFFKMS